MSGEAAEQEFDEQGNPLDPGSGDPPPGDEQQRAAAEAGGGPEGGDEHAKAEERARRMGWVPKEEFRGDPERWVDADKFLERGQNELPILRENYRKLEGKFESMMETTQQMVRKLGEFDRNQREDRVQAHQQRVSELKAERDAAVSNGDEDRYKALNRQIDDLESKAPAPPPKDEGGAGTPQGPSPEFKREFDTWRGDNPWYGRDMQLTYEAEQVDAAVLRHNPDMPPAQRLAEVTRIVRERHPDKFKAGGGGGSQRNAGSPVEPGGGGRPAGKRGQKKTVTDLPPEAKQYHDKFVNRDKIMSSEQYLREYFGDDYEG